MPKSASRTIKPALRKRSRAVAPSAPYAPWLIEQLKDPAEAAAYLEATYKMLSTSGNPELRSLKAVLAATGLRIAVRPIEKRSA